MAPPSSSTSPRIRREPPRYRQVTVRRVTSMTPRLLRVTLTGPELEGLTIDEPAASVRLLLPTPGRDELVMPTWNGNEFLLSGGRRPTLRTLTPLRVDPEALELDVEVVVHEGGVASTWASTARTGEGAGARAAVSGPGRGYAVDAGAPAFLLAGDETALPAIGQLLDVLPAGVPVQVHVEVAHPDARLPLPRPAVPDGVPEAAQSGPTDATSPGRVEWHDLPAGAAPGDALVAAVQGAELVDGVKVWVAGEAASVQRIRKHLFEERGLSRSQCVVRGYWKHGRAGGGDD